MTISNEAVEAAARALSLTLYGVSKDGWGWISDREKDILRDYARAALEAAAPLIQADAWDEGFSAALKQWRTRSDVENPYRQP